MTGNSDLSSAAVAEWKHTVQTFFREEWSVLRQMVLELEEQGWGADQVSSAVDHSSGLTSDSTAESESSRSQPVDDRLAQLAQSIELRMQNNNCGEF